MKLAVIALTAKGAALGQKITEKLNDEEITLYLPTERKRSSYRARYFQGPLSKQMTHIWMEYDGIVCIMALGIVIRMIAPYLNDKRTDPAVVVVDEKGQFAISALSGHWGGANALALKVGKCIGAQPVITTATDVNNMPAIEMVAKDMDLDIENFHLVKKINAAIVNEDNLQIYSEIPLPVEWPKHVQVMELEQYTNCGQDAKVVVTNKNINITKDTLLLRPRNLIVGVGCRRGIPEEKVAKAISNTLTEAGYSSNSIKHLASIDIKADEEGLIQAASHLGVPIKFFGSEEIDNLYNSEEGKNLSFSEFVQDKLGVGGVCEAVTLLSSQAAKLVVPKVKAEGVTVAIAEENWQ